jgi:hypothetical protein
MRKAMLVLATAAAVLAPVAVAHGAKLDHGDGETATWFYRAWPGEANDVTYSHGPGHAEGFSPGEGPSTVFYVQTEIFEERTVFIDRPEDRGCVGPACVTVPSCTRNSPTKVSCTTSGTYLGFRLETLVFELGDNDDRIDAVRLFDARIDCGSGHDTVINASPWASDVLMTDCEEVVYATS